MEKRQHISNTKADPHLDSALKSASGLSSLYSSIRRLLLSSKVSQVLSDNRYLGSEIEMGEGQLQGSLALVLRTSFLS